MTIEDVIQHREFMLNVARKFGANGYAEDVVQDQLLKLCEKQAQIGNLDFLEYKGEVNTLYLYTLTRNATIDLQRKKQPEFEAPIVHEDTTEEKLLLEACLKALDEVQSPGCLRSIMKYEITFLYFWRSMSYRKIEKETGIKVNTIKTIIKNVKDEIRIKVEQWGSQGKEVTQAPNPKSRVTFNE